MGTRLRQWSVAVNVNTCLEVSMLSADQREWRKRQKCDSEAEYQQIKPTGYVVRCKGDRGKMTVRVNCK